MGEGLEKRNLLDLATGDAKDKCRTVAVGGMAASTGAVVEGVEATTSTVARATMRTMRLARGLGGALSAAILVMEANAIHSTLKRMKNGSPCEKAQRIRNILNHVNGEKNEEDVFLPSTEALDGECQA